MCKNILMFDNIEIEKSYHNKTLILLEDVDIEKLLVSEKISFLVACKIIIKLNH